MATNGIGTFRHFRVVVPNRVDIAGGTLDIYPLYLLIGDAMTVNAAVAVRSEVVVRQIGRGASRLSSGNFGIAITAADTHGFPLDGKMGLLARGLRYYPAVSGVEIRVCNEAPIGSGIGASSALLVALMLAVGRLTGTFSSRDATARAAMEIEAAHLKSLAGRQDHMAALRGGLQGIRFYPGRVETLRLSPGGQAGKMLRDHAFLAHTGISHHSSDVNWRMIRGAIDGDGRVLRKFRGIASAARNAWEALSAADPRGTGAAIASEWAIRKTLAAGVSTAGVEELFSDRRFRRLVSGAKLCGAGGGGMLFGLLRDPDDREAAEAILSGAGMSILPFRLSGGPRFEDVGNAG